MSGYDYIREIFFSGVDGEELTKYYDKSIKVSEGELDLFKLDFRRLEFNEQEHIFNVTDVICSKKVFDDDSLHKIEDIICEDLGKTKKDISDENYYKTIIKYFEEKIGETKKQLSANEKIVSGMNGGLEELYNKVSGYDEIIKEKINETKDKLITLTVTVLGIFCSLTFSLSGSLGLLNGVFSSQNSSFAEALFKFSLIGMFVANLVFLLIYCIARLNNKSLAMHCSKCTEKYSEICNMCSVKQKQKGEFQYTIDCHGCEHRNVSCAECDSGTHWWSVFCKLRNKFYYIYLINIVCIVFLVSSTIMGICGTTDFIFRHNIDNNEQNQQTTKSEIIVTPSDIEANVNIDVNKDTDVQQSESEQHDQSKTNDELTVNNEQNTD